ncbi:MAG: WD40 repeat domain-containing protein, partial [Planctomycetaceae bacterium]|nr:WD40 repeat domain-containing protein [Planctomycetaceae bacterium]
QGSSGDYLDTGCFTADGKRFLYAGRECPMGIYDLGTRKQWDLSGTDKTLFCWGMTSSRNGCYLSTAEQGGKISLWRAETNPDYRMLPGTSDVATDLQWSPDGRWLVVSRNRCSFGLQNHTPSQILYDLNASEWNPVDMSQTPEIQVAIGELAPQAANWDLNLSQFSSDSHRLYTLSHCIGKGGWHVRTFDLQTLKTTSSVKLPPSFAPVDPEPAQFLVEETKNTFQILYPEQRQRSRLDSFDLKTGRMMKSFVLDGNCYRSPSAFHQEHFLLVDGKQLRLFDRHTGKVIRSFTPPIAGEFTGVTFSQDGKRIASCDSIGGKVFIHDCLSGSQLAILKSATNGSLQSLEFSPDGRRLAGGSTGHPNQADYIDVWNLTTSSNTEPRPPVVEIPIPASGYGVTSVRFSPDGGSLAAGIITNRAEQGALYRTPHRESAVAVWEISGAENPAQEP